MTGVSSSSVEAVLSVHHELRVVSPLDAPDEEELTRLMASSMLDVAKNGRIARRATRPVAPRLREIGATFVSVSCGQRVHGPVGSVRAVRPLALDAISNACHAAFEDPRLPPLGAHDIDDLAVDIDVVGQLVPIRANHYDDIVADLLPACDGLVLVNEGNSFTFLPTVWQTSRDASDFVALLWRKAGLDVGELPRRAKAAKFSTQRCQLRLVL